MLKSENTITHSYLFEATYTLPNVPLPMSFPFCHWDLIGIGSGLPATWETGQAFFTPGSSGLATRVEIGVGGKDMVAPERSDVAEFEDTEVGNDGMSAPGGRGKVCTLAWALLSLRDTGVSEDILEGNGNTGPGRLSTWVQELTVGLVWGESSTSTEFYQKVFDN